MLPGRNGAPHPGVGVLYRPADIGMPVVDLAHALADRGFDSIVVGEHTHIPIARTTPYPAGGELPDVYRRFMDPYVALAFVAAQTDLVIGTGIALVAQHDPIVLAKTVATLDVLSGGRFVFGVGYGWNREEYASHGRDFGARRTVAREHVALMRSLWRDEVAEFHGEHATLPPCWAWPKPVQIPGPPVLIGCTPEDRHLDEIVAWADGWMPGGTHLDWFARGLAALRERWHAAGRDDAGPTVWVMQDIDGVDDAQLCAQLESFRELGVAHVLLDIPTASADVVLPLLDRTRGVRAAVYG